MKLLCCVVVLVCVCCRSSLLMCTRGGYEPRLYGEGEEGRGSRRPQACAGGGEGVSRLSARDEGRAVSNFKLYIIRGAPPSSNYVINRGVGGGTVTLGICSVFSGVVILHKHDNNSTYSMYILEVHLYVPFKAPKP